MRACVRAPQRDRILLNSTSRPQAATFRTFQLSTNIQRGIQAAGFETPRPIQAKTIPEALKGRDVLGLAQTGTGKTAAFALPILERLSAKRGPGPRALIVAPTRELALQIHAEMQLLAQFTNLSMVTVFGGVAQGAQVRALAKRPDVIVACPGRLLDLLQQRATRLDTVEVLVLDEADHMFDMGFLPSVRRILAALPKVRQNLLFSATMPKEVRGLADAILQRPHVVELERSGPAETIEHSLYSVAETDKLDLLDHIVGTPECTSAIVFTRTKHRAKRIAERLIRRGHEAIALQGNMSQPQRERAMKGFRSGQFEVLVATDIAARGIDVADVSHVINFDVPGTPEAYTHRIGRTGRSECAGSAFTFVTSADAAAVRAIEKHIGQAIERSALPRFERSTPDPALFARGPRAAQAPRAQRGAPKGASKTAGRSRSATSRPAAARGATRPIALPKPAPAEREAPARPFGAGVHAAPAAARPESGRAVAGNAKPSAGKAREVAARPSTAGGGPGRERRGRKRRAS